MPLLRASLRTVHIGPYSISVYLTSCRFRSALETAKWLVRLYWGMCYRGTLKLQWDWKSEIRFTCQWRIFGFLLRVNAEWSRHQSYHATTSFLLNKSKYLTFASTPSARMGFLHEWLLRQKRNITDWIPVSYRYFITKHIRALKQDIFMECKLPSELYCKFVADFGTSFPIVLNGWFQEQMQTCTYSAEIQKHTYFILIIHFAHIRH